MEVSVLKNRFGNVIVEEIIRLINSVLHLLNIPYKINELESDYNNLNNRVGHNTSQINSINRKIKNVEIDEIYIGCGDSPTDVLNEDNKYTNFILGTIIELTPINQKLFALYKSDIDDIIELDLNGINIPCKKSIETYNDIEYRVLESENNYNINLNIEIK